jgi:hypothetical protein
MERTQAAGGPLRDSRASHQKECAYAFSAHMVLEGKAFNVRILPPATPLDNTGSEDSV